MMASELVHDQVTWDMAVAVLSLVWGCFFCGLSFPTCVPLCIIIMYVASAIATVSPVLCVVFCLHFLTNGTKSKKQVFFVLQYNLFLVCPF